MSDTTDNAVPKLVDFGLSTMIFPTQTTSKPYGTVGYCAPEVLQSKPYRYSCDLWSYGCLIHALLSRSLPFDGDIENEVI